MPTYIANFTNVVAPLRYDGLPWTEVIVSEGSAQDDGEGPPQASSFSPIATISLASLPQGLDADPSRPAERSFTVSGASESGWYALTWQDAAGNQSRPAAPIFLPQARDELRPTLTEVGSILPTRTVSSGSAGTQLGTFSSQTLPTDVQVEALIDQAIRQVLLKTGPGIPDQYRDEARTVVLYLTSALVELSYFKEEIAKETSAYPMLLQNYKDALQGLLDSMESGTPGTPTQSFWTVPIQNASQARFGALMAAIDPETGLLDPTQLPADMAYPNGPGGLPAWNLGVANAPWSFDLDSGSFLDSY